ncbi:MAG TPA: diacylglycerol kinase [Oceanipulchritudo sp.]|nr:diacylglycerol kinase [Oceanipulchritudo sp.]
MPEEGDPRYEQPSQGEEQRESWPVHFLKSAGYSLEGLGAAWKHEMAFRMEVAALCILAPMALLVPVGLLFKALVLSSMLLVLAVELLNSAMEWAVDYISHDRHPYAKTAKDMGSAAVFVSLINAGLMWGLLIWEWIG